MKRNAKYEPCLLSVNTFFIVIIQQDLWTRDKWTLKTNMTFRWASEFCSDARHIRKTDMFFIDIWNLVMFLLNLSHPETFSQRILQLLSSLIEDFAKNPAFHTMGILERCTLPAAVDWVMK